MCTCMANPFFKIVEKITILCVKKRSSAKRKYRLNLLRMACTEPFHGKGPSFDELNGRQIDSNSFVVFVPMFAKIDFREKKKEFKKV